MAVQACHECLSWMIPLLDPFPRVRRFTLGERIETLALAILEALVEASFSRQDKGAWLDRANRKLAVLRHLWRLCYELRVISMRRYEHGARLFDELGRQIGGWRKAVRQKKESA